MEGPHGSAIPGAVLLHKLVSRVGIVAACLAGAGGCGGNGTGDDGVGDDGPIYAEDHPRIYLNANRERLAGALTAGTPAATRFKEMVDRWVDGGDVYGFEPWYAALIGQLTGDARYCTG